VLRQGEDYCYVWKVEGNLVALKGRSAFVNLKCTGDCDCLDEGTGFL
jgi:hypothetical protein